MNSPQTTAGNYLPNCFAPRRSHLASWPPLGQSGRPRKPQAASGPNCRGLADQLGQSDRSAAADEGARQSRPLLKSGLRSRRRQHQLPPSSGRVDRSQSRGRVSFKPDERRSSPTVQLSRHGGGVTAQQRFSSSRPPLGQQWSLTLDSERPSGRPYVALRSQSEDATALYSVQPKEYIY